MKKQKTIKAVLVDTDNGIITPATIKNDLQSFYHHLDCSTIDIVKRKFNGEWLDLIVDDEGLLKESNREKIAVFTLDKSENVVETIVGNVLIVRHDKDGNTISLKESDYSAIVRSMIRLHNGKLALLARI